MNSNSSHQTQTFAKQVMAARQLDLDQTQTLSYLKLNMVVDLKPCGKKIHVIHLDGKAGYLLNGNGAPRAFANFEQAQFVCENILSISNKGEA